LELDILNEKEELDGGFCELKEMTELEEQMKGDCINDFHCTQLRDISLNEEFLLTRIPVECL
jgi:hypothetical protein